MSPLNTDQQTIPEWQHKVVQTRPYRGTDCDKGREIKVEAGLHYLQGNSRPYFSVQGEVFKPGARDCDMCGCIHAEVLKHFPKFGLIVDLHLCDDNGVPMHAEANGWYQLAGYYGGNSERYHAGNSKGQHGGEYREPTREECLEQWARHLRIDIKLARELADWWRTNKQDELMKGIDGPSIKAIHNQFVREQEPRWKQEADAAIALLDQLAVEKGFGV